MSGKVGEPFPRGITASGPWLAIASPTGVFFRGANDNLSRPALLAIPLRDHKTQMQIAMTLVEFVPFFARHLSEYRVWPEVRFRFEQWQCLTEHRQAFAL